ncbi:heat-inducible transcriptional repressor HrcA [Geothrix sp. PMB-07]|uniref:heat-inducible transcriptional repressor HrcA n=1 Tax=Geothrix sp. PMB-07 TaxID=3068640 RepID=UPI0027410E6A|nr:heat-inducible transcriptional repressor HrcA [Geothrix sp. PMB-07]WLT30614.1 heat-inducible transcriptional repressor HrcA [Geothrix sp. PMB-07]
MARPKTDPHLNLRGESVLRTLIETYLEEGEPVGSRLLAKRYPEPLSSATIRNVLSDLEDESMVAQPHTSAGRIPTERAYRYYLDRWMTSRPLGPELEGRLSSTLEGLDTDPEAWARHASRTLAEVMGGVCVALPLPLTQSRLVRLEFIPVPPGRLVAVWVGSLGEVEHRLMENPWNHSEAVLTELGNYATAHFSGLTLGEMRSRLLEALRAGVQEGESIRGRLQELAARWPEGSHETDPPVLVSGLGRLGELPEFEDLPRFRDLVAAFEEHGRLAKLLNAFAGRASEDVQFLLGTENPYFETWPLATAVRTVALGPSGFVTFALVGPLRMDYGRVMGGLQWWSRQVQRRRGQA